MNRKRAMSSSKASKVRSTGREREKLFANYIGVPNNYKNNPQAKKDVIDKNGDAHSVKSGSWWQIFLYRRSRLIEDPGFEAMNGIGQQMILCLDVFPDNRDEYLQDKNTYKIRLSKEMFALKNKIKNRLKSFLDKSIFNSGEVTYFTIHEHIDGKDVFHVFYSKNVLEILFKEFIVENSKAKNNKQHNNQKVLFKVNKRNIGELEIRTDSPQHYKEIKLRFNAGLVTSILKDNITPDKPLNKNIVVYGKAIKKFLNKHEK